MNKKMTPTGNSSFALVQLLGMFLLIFLFLFSIFAYVIVETRTALYLEKIEKVEEICELPNNPVKFIKIMDYQKYIGFSKIYCAYADSDDNRILELNYRKEKWSIVLDTNVNKERSLHWPIYF